MGIKRKEVIMRAEELKYNDIINLPHHQSSKHPRMSIHDRAAQFSPFAALTGHDEAIKETARLTDEWVELDEDVKVELDKKIRFIKENIGTDLEVTITYFKPDETKEGGKYCSVTGQVKKIDEYSNTILMKDKKEIQMKSIRMFEFQ